MVLFLGVFASSARGSVITGSLADSVGFLEAERAQTQVAALVCSLDHGDTLLAIDPSRRLIPGSNAKLFTTGSFLRQFGPEYRRDTIVLARGKISLGDHGRKIRLQGDLVLRGSGMPDVYQILAPGSRGLLDSLAFLLRAQGLEKFEGTVWVDGSLFAQEPYGPGWAVDDLPYWYGAPVNAVMANGNGATVSVTGTDHGVQVALDPPETPLRVESSVTEGDSRTPPRLDIARSPGSHVLVLTGSVPPNALLKKQVSVPYPDSAAAVVFLGALRRAGIAVKAVARVLPPKESVSRERDAKGVARLYTENDGFAIPATTGWKDVKGEKAVPVLALESPPTGDVIGSVNALSMNAEAEALLRLLDPAPAGKTPGGGIARVMAWVARTGIDTLDLSLVDGSGLSPMDLVTPRAIVTWLTAMDRDSTLGPVFRGGLARPGGLGTLHGRLGGLEGGADVHAKSGTLSNVSALSGYLTTASGERLVFSILSNGSRGSVSSSKEAEDRLVTLLSRYRRGATRPVWAPPFGIPR
jgi:D-alanyl-D-alanine carboxypeptidase/D-alanyl-D-alanine-endopeptidase (penicillin-binding protein 4)